MAERCEPPDELRDRDGWFWLDSDRPIVCMWQYDPWSDTGAWKMPGSNIWGPDSAYRHGYRYIGPVTPPRHVMALVRALAEIEVVSNQQAVRDIALAAIAAAQSMPNSGSRIVPQTDPDCPKPAVKESLTTGQPIEIPSADGGRDRD